MKRKVLVTGATGLVGSHILIDLVKSDDCVIIACKRYKSDLSTIRKIFSHYQLEDRFTEIQWIDLDLNQLNTDNFLEIDEVIHTAAVVSFSPKNYDSMDKTNVAATQELLEIAKSKGAKKFGFISSIASLGRAVDGGYYTEQSPWVDSKANSYYSQTKYLSEQIVLKANSENFQTYLCNPGVILGPGDWNRSSGTIFKTAIKGIRFYTKGITGFVDVRDVSKAMLMIMKSEHSANRFILVSGNHPFKDIFCKIANTAGSKPPSIHASKLLTSIGWRMDTLIAKIRRNEPSLTKENARTSHGVSKYDNNKIKTTFDYSFYSLDDTIANTIEFLKANNYF